MAHIRVLFRPRYPRKDVGSRLAMRAVAGQGYSNRSRTDAELGTDNSDRGAAGRVEAIVRPRVWLRQYDPGSSSRVFRVRRRLVPAPAHRRSCKRWQVYRQGGRADLVRCRGTKAARTGALETHAVHSRRPSYTP